MPSFTFVSTANAFALRGGVPVFVDIRPDTLNIDEALVAAAVTSRTKAIVPVHYAGVACEMGAILALADAHRLFVVEDAAQAMLSTWQGRFLGTLGHLGCLSFHETKSIVSGEGGALLVNDERFIARAEVIREKGTDRSRFFRGEVDRYSWLDLGSSYLPSELVGAFLFAQLEHADQIVAERGALCRRYAEGLADLARRGRLALPGRHADDREAGGQHFAVLAQSRADRDGLIAALDAAGIHAVFHYVPLHLSPAGRQFGRKAGPLPVTEDAADRLVRLPLYRGLGAEGVDQVLQAVQAHCGG